jgi:biotin carboxyl carrier protein
MRRYTIEVDGRSFVVDVQEQDGDAYAVAVDGQEFQVRLVADDEAADGQALRVVPAAAAAARASTRPPSPAQPPGAAAAQAAPGVGSALKAPMPGLLLRVLVAAGAKVQRGQDLAVLEAMKMENVIRAPADGTVLETCARAGQQLAHGDVILRYQASGGTPGTA